MAIPSPYCSKRLTALVASSLVVMLASIEPGYARVGVTSQTNGDPLGKPPAEVERVLHVGIDIQANELITTKQNDRAHVVFLDGTALTVGPNAQLVIDRYVYDPKSRTGELAISATKGVMRLVGGKISKTSPMIVTTPSATLGVRGGIALFVVNATETKAAFLYGISLTASAQGRTETAKRPGSLIVTKSGSPPSPPTLIASGDLREAVAALEASGGGNGSAADSKAQESGFSAFNSGQPLMPGDLQLDRTGNANQAVSNAGDQSASGTFSGSSSLSGSSSPTGSSFSGTSSFTGSSSSPGSLSGGSSGAGGVSSPPPPVVSPPPTTIPFGQTIRATPAVGVGNGGLVPAIPAAPSAGRR